MPPARCHPWQLRPSKMQGTSVLRPATAARMHEDAIPRNDGNWERIAVEDDELSDYPQCRRELFTLVNDTMIVHPDTCGLH